MTGLLQEGYFALFLIVALGVALGHLKVRGLSLDVSAVIFVALIFGHYGVSVPGDFQKLGLVLFIYTIGLQSGSGFFEAFRKHGRQLILLASVIVGSGAVTTVLLGWWLGFDFKLGVGLLAGAMTSTPGLAAAIDSARSPLASIGYGVAYPFGVIGVILFARLLPRMLGIDIGQSKAEYDQSTRSDYPDMTNQNFVVENPKIAGRTIGETGIGTMTGATISRVTHDAVTVTPTRDTVLHKGDLIKAVGTRSAMDKVALLVGSQTDIDVPLAQGHEVTWLLVTNKEVVGKRLAELNLWALYNASITRIRRSGIDIAPAPQSALRFGDKLMVASDRDSMVQLAKLLGNDDRRLSEANPLPVALGLVLGILLGEIVLPVGGLTLSLGTTGGVLVAALVLSRLGKTGPILWRMSGYASQLLRELGLLFFLAAVGTSAGAHLVETLAESGLSLVLAGMAITLLPMILGALVGHYFLRVNFLSLLGVITGSMTSTPGLAAVDPMSDSNAPAVAYATVYPIALVGMIVVCQVIARM
jgi:putative transport protein